MFCQNCGTEVRPGQSFCSGCSRPLSDYALAAQTSRLQRNLQLLGIFWIAYSAISVLGGVVLVIIANALFGPAGHTGAPLFLQPMLTTVGVFLIVKAALGIAAGWGLMQREHWARILAVVLGFLALIHIPLGTALGIYTLWVLLSPGADDEYRALAAHA
ncbi:MAG: zinc-ribbon domain-containing protein [Actinomycetota bacterium]